MHSRDGQKINDSFSQYSSNQLHSDNVWIINMD